MLIKGYSWLDNVGLLPRIVQEGIKLYGTMEVPGSANNPVIMGWADEVGVPALGYKYTGDSVPWCGLFMAVIAKRAGKKIPYGPLYALNWAQAGNAIKDAPQLGDYLTFRRDGGGHVGLYIAEDKEAYHVLGGNQSDKVSVTRIAKSRLYRARRPEFMTRLPDSARPYYAAATGVLSKNEK